MTDVDGWIDLHHWDAAAPRIDIRTWDPPLHDLPPEPDGSRGHACCVGCPGASKPACCAYRALDAPQPGPDPYHFADAVRDMSDWRRRHSLSGRIRSLFTTREEEAP